MRAAAVNLLRNHRMLTLVLLDGSAWFAGMYFASTLRLEQWETTSAFTMNTSAGHIPAGGVLILGTFAIVLHTLIAWFLRLHQGRSVLGSFEEIFVLASVLAAVGAVVTAFNFFAPSLFLPRTTPIVAALVALVLCAWPRGLWRILIHEATPHRREDVAIPVIIAGAGEAGCQLALSMQRDAAQTWRPLGFLDDDAKKRHFRYRGLNVLGTFGDLAKSAVKVGADTVVIAMPGATSATVNRIYEDARAASLAVKVLPNLNELLNGVNQAAVRDIEPEDLLGRHQIETDISSIAGYLYGKRVLVTGAGGSIGSELCRQISTFGPSELMMLDRDESALHTLLLSLRGRADLESPDAILANIRDTERLQEVFETRCPQVVFHAAALKHVNMLETQASEAVKTNVLGTLNVLEAALAVDVERFVNISTDKAADPQNVLGYSKRIAEGLTTAIASEATGVYLSVRFGNVLGTSGSVLKTFAAQIKSGGPVTVTHPDVTRFFMTVHEAVQLVVQAAAIGRDGEALVLDMGEPVKILTVAQQLIDQAHGQIEIEFTGLKNGEKLHETLLGSGETDHRPIHPLVSHVPVPPTTRDDVLSLPQTRNNAHLVAALREMSERMRLSEKQGAEN